MKYFLSFSYILIIILSNLLASNIFLDYNGIIVLTVGTVTFGLVFVLRDLLHKYGKLTVYKAILIAVLSSVILNFVTNTPIQIVIASALGLIVGEVADTEVFHKLTTKNWLVRALTSNSISIPLDSLMFNVIAFVGTSMQPQILGLTLADILYKLLIAGILSLGIYRLSNSIKTHKKIA
jgi:queuosine precursor transporter